MAAERSYPATEVSGSREETPHARGQGQWLRGATPHLRPGAVAERSYPASEISGSQEETPRIRGRGSGQEELPRVGGRGGWEKPPHA